MTDSNTLVRPATRGGVTKGGKLEAELGWETAPQVATAERTFERIAPSHQRDGG